MPRFLITETYEYEIEADDLEAAEEAWNSTFLATNATPFSNYPTMDKAVDAECVDHDIQEVSP